MWLHASILKIYSIQCLCIWICMLLSQYVKADPLLNTDDTNIVQPKKCQIESGVVAAHQPANSYQFNLACQWIDGLETSLIHATQSFHQNHIWATQIKGVIHPMDRWGMAASFMVSEQTERDKHYLEWFMNIPISLVYFNNSLYVNSNIGYQYASENLKLLRWSLASSLAFTPKTSVSIETYNQDRHAPLLQSAIHYSFIPDILTFEASIGQRLNSFRERWFGFGLSFTP